MLSVMEALISMNAVFPLVSVIMPVYNAAPYLREAIDSILNQTFTDFELLAIDDGSTDNSRNIISEYTDSRIRLIVNDKNLKIVKTLNKGIALSRGKYIARMDSDDISVLDRLEKQVKYMELHPDVDICGSNFRVFGTFGEELACYPSDDVSIRKAMIKSCSFCHPSVIMRKASLVRYNLKYDEQFLYAEDYDLWSKGILYLKYHNIDEVLLNYRKSGQNTSFKKNTWQHILTNAITLRNIAYQSIKPCQVDWIRFSSGKMDLEELKKATILIGEQVSNLKDDALITKWEARKILYHLMKEVLVRYIRYGSELNKIYLYVVKIPDVWHGQYWKFIKKIKWGFNSVET